MENVLNAKKKKIQSEVLTLLDKLNNALELRLFSSSQLVTLGFP